ncbi:hypothetical protein LSM04_004017 [Trypanosoma melophagium]|uniref:uncharacterized protein n=1 Tax=Trypanosoma melophagium TaxID=715481 RepID=UPI00351A292C|nr:hypothetical protein LSM04_004017 [Trypanosoma melophagium]
MLRDRFAHLRIQDSDSDSDDARRTTRPQESAFSAPAVAETGYVSQVLQQTITKSESSQVVLQPAEDIMSREEMPKQSAKDCIRIPESAGSSKKVSVRNKSTPSERDVITKSQATAPSESEVNRKRISTPSEKDIVRRSDLIASYKREVNLIKVSTPSERDFTKENSKQLYNVLDPPITPSGGSFSQGVQERRGPPKRGSINSLTASERSKQGKEESGSVNLLMIAQNKEAKLTGHLSSAKEDLVEEQTQGQTINIGLSSQKEDNREEEVSSPVRGLQDVGSGEKREKKGNSEIQQSQSASTPLSDSKSKAAEILLSEKYWEKTYGFDPSKRGLPLFVAVEHCSPKNPGAGSRLPQRNSLRVNSEGPCSVRSSQNKSVNNNIIASEHDLLIPEVFRPSGYNDIHQQEESGFTGCPLVEDTTMMDTDGKSTIVGVHNADRTLSAEEVRKYAKGDSIKEGISKSSKNSVHGSACEKVPSRKEQVDAFIEDEVEFKEKYEGDHGGDGNNKEKSDVSKVEEKNQLLPSDDKNVIHSPNSVVADQGENLIEKDENHQKLENGNLSVSDVMNNARAKEHLLNGTSHHAFPEEKENDVKEQNSQEEVDNSHPLREGALQNENGMVENNGEVLSPNELTLGNIEKLTGDESGMAGIEILNNEVSYTESSLFMSCISMPTADMRDMMRRQKFSRHYVQPNYRQRNQSRAQNSSLPPYHRRLLLDLEEKRERDRKMVERSIEEYTFQPKTSGRRSGRLPHRVHKPAEASVSASASASGPLPITTETREALQERSRAGSRRIPGEEPLPSFKPEISKYARETQRPAIPYHERLYTPKPVSLGPDGVVLSNGDSPQLSPRMVDLIESSNFVLFRPDISPRARAIANGNPFHQRLYPSKEELERRRAKSQSPPVSPRRPSPQRGSVQISPRLLERPAPPPEVPSYSFRPEISPRAKNIENVHPFHQRLYPEKELLKRRAKSQSPPVSPRRPSPQRGSVQISPRLLERPAPPPEVPSYSFRPEISPRAKSISRQGPFYERLYQLKDEKDHQEGLQNDSNSAFISSFHPNITERGQHAYENDDGVRRNVVKRLSKPKEVFSPPFDPSLTFHPMITMKAKMKKQRNSNSNPQLLINGASEY